MQRSDKPGSGCMILRGARVRHGQTPREKVVECAILRVDGSRLAAHHLATVGTSRRYRAPTESRRNMPERRTYMDRKRAGEAVDILDEIDAWHESDSAAPLHEWLGMSWHEYAIAVTGKAPGMNARFELHLDQASIDASWERAMQYLRNQGEDVEALMKRAIENVETLREPRILQDTGNLK